jgi:hypothetical protein
MVKVTIELNGREVSEAEAGQIIYDTILDSKIERVKAAIGDLPLEIHFRGSLQELKMSVKNCPDELVPELRRRLEPFVQPCPRDFQPAKVGARYRLGSRNTIAKLFNE